jgi:hypothetical protein
MKAHPSILAIATLLSALACKEDKPAPQTTTSENTTSNAGLAAPSVSSPSPHAHRMCPSRARGATVTANDVDGGVVISISASDDATIAEVQARAANLPTAATETKRGRFCPELHEGASRTITNTKTGADITLVPTNASDVATLRSDVRDRLAHGEKRPD